MADNLQFNNNNSEQPDARYKITPAKTDVESVIEQSFNPFKERTLEHPTTDGETLTHLLKASLGTGILAMPIAFSYAGLVGGIIATILTALICTHCAYVLVKCAHTLYHRNKTTTMTFAEIAQVSLENGPEWGRRWSKFIPQCITYGLFVTYFGTCAVYTVIIATNFQQVIEHYLGSEVNLRLMIALLLLPLILLSWIPNLKYLAPVSMVANVFMCVGLGITFYYLVTDMPPLAERPLFVSLMNWPSFFAIVIFAMEAIGVVMPLENQMKTPQNFIGICGVLNQGMGGVTLIYILLGFLGYVRYGDQALGSITLNLPVEELPAQAVKILIALAVYCTFGLQFYVCLDIAWIGIRNRFKKRPTLVNYTMRTILVTAAVLLAVAVPTIGPFIGLIGAFCFSILGLLIPILIEMVTYWDQGFGQFNWIIWKNVLVFFFGIVALIFGSKSSIEDIIKLYVQ
ncbi:proton-coupled amino acid transporter-like protein pathetic isoform X2 [Malaya genurostris]|uniref:proton-coupled amino acid transporter-like protein pathetic isoform X2 n=1 Tax=Malaya genurostris TaxID=325434 RepID=UPI0026F3F530|nr:proton-coupled amino acid transporter-like protein pathetic isoform X2 [Malaya genurostris]